MEVAFQDKVRYEFAAQFVQQPAAALFGAALHAHTLTITIDHPVVGRLLQRVAEGRCAVLPFIHGTTDAWLTAGATQRELDRTLAQVVRFVLPTYAEFAGGGTSPHRRAFDPSGNQLQQSGAALYDAGYYTWRSPAAYRDTILQRLDLWMAL